MTIITHQQPSRESLKSNRCLLAIGLTLLGLLSGVVIAPHGLAAWAPYLSTESTAPAPEPGFVLNSRLSPWSLGNYANTPVQLGANTTITPDAAPTGTTSINVSTSTNFKGRLEGNPTTGVVRVTDAHPTGTYTVTVTAFDGGPSTKTFTLTVTTPATCNPVSFAAATDFSVGTNARSVAVGDFNGDGKQDLAVVNGSSNVSVLLGDGAGSFGAATNFVVGSGPFSVAVGDFNGDGKQDLTTANNGSSDVSVLLGDGAGGFGAVTSFSVGTNPRSVAVGDFNGDSKQDLAVVNRGSNTVSVLLGNGAGSFGAATNFAVGNVPNSVAVGDFNGDGKQDLAVANNTSGNVSILLGDGAGSFGAATNFGAITQTASVTVGDFNNDGKQDLATANNVTSNTVSVLVGDGAGSFSAAMNFSGGANPQSVAVGDFNGDGSQDLVTANVIANTVSMLFGNGAAGFTAPTTFAVGNFPQSVAVGDFNGDGKQDLVTANTSSGNVSVLLRQCPPLVVTSTNDSGAGSLRQAILDSNSTPGVQTIAFNIPGGGVKTIQPVSPLPIITAPVTIDGYTQPGASANTLTTGNDATLLIELDGGIVGASFAKGLDIQASDCLVRGLVINRWGGSGVSIASSTSLITNNAITGCFIGTNAAGTVSRSNAGGVIIEAGETGNFIGAPANADRNLISGNGIPVLIQTAGTNNNTVQNNYIGTDRNGTALLLNQAGIELSGVSGTVIGGTAAGAGNVILGNLNPAILELSAVGGGATIQGNKIGTNAAGTAPLGKGSIFLSTSNNLIGGTTAGAGNIIASSNDAGVAVVNSTGNAILGNSIHSNAGLGIDLASNGVTANDAGDPDAGANNLQNFPVLTSALSSGGNTAITGTLNSTATLQFRVEFFSNPACDAFGNGEGQTFLGSTVVTTDGSGNANINANLPSVTSVGQAVTATATDPNGNTSEFSACRQVAAGAVFGIDGRVLDNSGNALAGVNVALSGSASINTTTDVSGNYGFVNLAAGGNYTVTPSSSNYSFGPVNQTFSNLNVNRIANFVGTQTTVSITGKVVDGSDVPINNVTVALTKNGAAAGTVQTNVLGDYSFANQTAGANYVVTPTGTFAPSSQNLGNLTANATANFKAAPSIPSQCSAVSFAAATSVAAGSSPGSVAIADFNGDGNSDVAVANEQSGNVSIFLGTGTGSFSAATNFAAGTGPSSVAVGDFNGDGKSDLAVANITSNNVSILLGAGTGSFAAATNFGADVNPRSVAIGDFNNDGNSDLAVANNGSACVSILLGTGAGSFGAPTDFGVDVFPQSVAIGDFNNDGNSDLAVVTGGQNEVSILLGTGTGSFGAPAFFAVGGVPQPIAVSDFNNDGNSDLAVAKTGSGGISILLGTGTGSFGAATNFVVGNRAFAVAIGDFNGDNKSDLAVADFALGNASIALGTGTGSFGVAFDFAVGGGPQSVAISDFNSDGKSDLAVANSASNNVSILLNNSGTCNTQSSLTISGRVATATNASLPDVTVTLSGPATRVTQTDVNGNYAFPNLAPGGNYTVTVQSNYFVFAPSRQDFFNLSSNQVTNFVAAPLAVPSPTPTPDDDFTSTVRDASKWSIGTQTSPSAAFDPQVTTAQVNGQLVVTPLSQAVGMHYAGYVSANSFDMRNGSARVEVVKAATGGADTIFAIGSDTNNFFRFMVHTAGGPASPVTMLRGRDGFERPLDTTVSQLIFQVTVGGQLTSLSINYDPLQHRFMRFRHEPLINSIAFETSPNNIDFTVQHRVTLQRSVSALTAELSAGTSNPTNPGPAVFDNFGLVTSTFQFSAGSYSVGEGDGSILVTVTRAGSLTDAAAVDFATSDGTARQKTKYTSAAGTLTFAAGVASRTFRVLLIDNQLTEGDQTLSLLLSNPVGSGLNSPGRAILNILDNDTTLATTNSLDDARFFVTQHYYDFLSRVPDQSGLDFWIGQITLCGTDVACLRTQRITVSNAFFFEQEYQQTGAYVVRLYRAAYGNNQPLSNPDANPQFPNENKKLVSYAAFSPDRARVRGGPQLAQTQLDLANAFVLRPQFLAKYPASLDGPGFVDAVLATINTDIGVNLSSQRNALIDLFNQGGRGRVMYRIADDNTTNPIDNRAFIDAEYNRAFVLTQYFGYLRRNPDIGGFLFWLGQVNSVPLRSLEKQRAMVCSFITSLEYQQRFSPVATHNNTECQ